MNSGWDFVFLLMAGAMPGFWLGVMIEESTQRIVPEMTAYAFDKCASNEGLEYFNTNVIVCNNGAEFTYD